MGIIERGQVLLANFYGAGSEVQKPRPCVVVSPDASNARAATFIVVPLTTQLKPYPMRVELPFLGHTSFAMLDQIQVMSPVRVISGLEAITTPDLHHILDRLQEMFAV